jgi:hypothetical protein
LSPTELHLSDEIDWISSRRVNDNMRKFFREFDDSLPNPLRMNSKIWFHRATRTVCTACTLIYRPHKDRQRYCYGCQKWYHLGCLGDGGGGDEEDFTIPEDKGELDVDILGKGDFPLIWEEVLQGPTVRGHGGVYVWSNNWLNTGSGVQKGLIEGWKREGSYPDDWRVELGEDFLEDFVIGKSWNWYPCPTCAIVI